MENDGHVIEQLKNGEKAAFKQVYRDYYGMLFNLGVQYLCDEDEAREVVQNAYLKLWEVRTQINDNSNIRNYLFTLVKNSSLNQLKRRQLILNHNENIRRKELEYQFEALHRLSYDYMEFEELKEKIDVVVDKLPSHCKNVFCMSRYDGLRNSEIASQLNISEKTVEAHITKALKILRVELKNYLSLAVFLHLFL